MKGIRIEGSKRGRLIVVGIDVDIKDSNWVIWYTEKFKQTRPCHKKCHFPGDRTKNPKCPVCGEETLGVFYQDPDEGFWVFLWKCKEGHTRDVNNKNPKCPYCGKETLHIEYEDANGGWESFWSCNCERVINEEKEANCGGY